MSRVLSRALVALCSTVAVLGALFAPGASAAKRPKAVFAPISWAACADVPGWECATVEVPRSYAHPGNGTFKLAVTRLPASDKADRIGALFVNYGGPGGDAVQTTQDIGADLFAGLTDRFDLVAIDPRGVGQSQPSVDCDIDQERYGAYAKPFTTPENLDVKSLLGRDQTYIKRCQDLNKGVLQYLSTANVARDMDVVRRAMGEDRINYLGFSYGTFLGATYAKLFPSRYRALVLDGAVDPGTYIGKPLLSLRQQTAGFERAFGRFLQACAAHPEYCTYAGGDDPWAAFDEIATMAEANPLPNSLDPSRPVTGDDVRAAAALAMYNKFYWTYLTEGLNGAMQGDAFFLRLLADAFFARNDDGSYDPAADRYVAISAAEMKYPTSVPPFLEAGEDSWNMSDHFWFNNGYTELLWGLWPVQAQNVYSGPWTLPKSAQTALVVGTTYDPATPYRNARRMTSRLENARLLTMRGDGHTAYGGQSTCIDTAVDTYLERLTLPDAGTVCRQEEPAYPPAALQGAQSARGAAARIANRFRAPFVR